MQQCTFDSAHHCLHTSTIRPVCLLPSLPLSCPASGSYHLQRVRLSDLLLLKHKAASEREAAKCGRAVWDPDRNCRHASGISCADALWKDEFKFGAVVPSCVQIRLTPLRLEQINTLRPEIALEANWRLRNRPKRCPAC